MNWIGRRPRAIADEGGQSLVEVALCLPILLLIVIGIVDIGRVYSYKVAATSAAREAAIYAARDARSTSSRVIPEIDGVCERALTEFTRGPVAPCALVVSPDPDFDPLRETWRSPTFPAVSVICTRAPAVACGNNTSPVLYQTDGAGGAEVTVTVNYRISLVSGYLVSRAFDSSWFRADSIRLGATATVVGLSQ